MLDNIEKVTVCGGGNAAHVVVPLLKSYGLSVTLYTPFVKEAEVFINGASRGGITLIKGLQNPVTGAADLVTTEPKEAAKAELILLVLPAFAHGPTLEALAPYLGSEVFIGAIPARSGFELQAASLLDIKLKKRVVFSGQTLPWACRIIEAGSKVNVLGTKEKVGLATVPSSAAVDLSAWFSRVLKVNFKPMASSLAVSLGNVGQVIHPGIMYGLLSNYNDTVWTADQVPLFYQGVTDEIASLLEALSAEIVHIAHLLSQKHDLDLNEVITVSKWLNEAYSDSIEDNSTLANAFCTNRSYRGLKLPVVKSGDGYKPDFQSRYLIEDIPYGLLYSKAVAGMVGCPTPKIDQVIRSTEIWVDKKYIDASGAINGPDAREARIPQNFGINSSLQLVQISQGLEN